MGLLDKLHKKIYQTKKEPEIKERLTGPYEYKPGREPPQHPNNIQATEAEWQDYIPQRLISPLARKYLAIAIVVLLFTAAAIASFAYWRGITSFSAERVTLNLVGPKTIEAGEVVTIQAFLENNNPIPLNNIRLKLYYPRNSTIEGESTVNLLSAQETSPISALPSTTHVLPVLEPQKKTFWEDHVRLVGAQGESLTMRAEVEYTPSSVTSRLRKKAELITRITDVPIRLTVVTPRVITAGQEVRYEMVYENFSEIAFQDVRLNVIYPQGFELISSTPEPQLFDNTWFLGTVMPHQRGKVVLKGRLFKEKTPPLVQAVILIKNKEGLHVPYTMAESSSQVEVPPLAVSLVRIGERKGQAGVQLGQSLRWRVELSNTTESIIRNVQLTAKFEGDLFDYNTIKGNNNAAYSINQKRLLWDESRTSKLSILDPFESRTFEFNASLKQQASFPVKPDKPLTAKVTVSVTTPTPPAELAGLKMGSEAESIVVLRSVLLAESEIVRGSAALLPDGPDPPKPNQRSLFTLAIRLKNAYNDLEDVTVKTTIPTPVHFEQVWWPPGEDVFYNQATGELTWQVKQLPAGKGLLDEPRQLLFQVSLTPADNDVGKGLPLLLGGTARGKDTITGAGVATGVPGLGVGVSP